MNIHTGMTEREVDADQDNKKKVLAWMVKNKLEDIEDIGRSMRAFYADEEGMIKNIEKGLSPDKVL